MPTDADIIFTEVSVFTADNELPTARAVAVKGMYIVYVGDEPGVKDWKAAHTRVIRGDGHTLMPGFIDSHFHMQHGSLSLDEIHFETCFNEQAGTTFDLTVRTEAYSGLGNLIATELS